MPPRKTWLLSLLALLVLLPAGGVAVAHSRLLGHVSQAEPPPPSLGGVPQQPLPAHAPPAALTPAAQVDAHARQIAAAGHDRSRPLPDGFTPTPSARPGTPSPAQAHAAGTPFALQTAAAPLLSTPPPTPSPPPLPTARAGRTPSATPPAPTATATATGTPAPVSVTATPSATPGPARIPTPRAATGSATPRPTATGGH